MSTGDRIKFRPLRRRPRWGVIREIDSDRILVIAGIKWYWITASQVVEVAV